LGPGGGTKISNPVESAGISNPAEFLIPADPKFQRIGLPDLPPAPLMSGVSSDTPVYH
jgi:hypothetical protein